MMNRMVCVRARARVRESVFLKLQLVKTVGEMTVIK